MKKDAFEIARASKYASLFREVVDIFVDEEILAEPLHWKNTREIAVCAATDLFGEWATDEEIDRVFAVMALCPQHHFQVLTRQPERMHTYLTQPGLLFRWGFWASHAIHTRESNDRALKIIGLNATQFPLPNVTLAISSEVPIAAQTSAERAAGGAAST